MATVQRVAKPEDRQYADIWNRYDWKCTKCGKIYQERWRARECCGGN